jgi:anti-sigma factor RsiW
MAELVTRYLDGGLPLRTRLAAMLHLWLCAACRRYVEQVRATIRFLGSGPPPPPPENENKIIALFPANRGES